MHMGKRHWGASQNKLVKDKTRTVKSRKCQILETIQKISCSELFSTKHKHSVPDKKYTFAMTLSLRLHPCKNSKKKLKKFWGQFVKMGE